MADFYNYDDNKLFLMENKLSGSISINMQKGTFFFKEAFMNEVNHFRSTYGDKAMINSWEINMQELFNDALNSKLEEEFGHRITPFPQSWVGFSNSQIT